MLNSLISLGAVYCNYDINDRILHTIRKWEKKAKGTNLALKIKHKGKKSGSFKGLKPK